MQYMECPSTFWPLTQFCSDYFWKQRGPRTFWSQFVSASTMDSMTTRKEEMSLDWHIQFRGVYTRIAEQLKVDPFQWTEFSRTQVQGQVLTTLLQGTSVPASLT